MKIMLCTCPSEPLDHLKANGQNIRSSGELPVTPKIAISSLMKWMDKNGYPLSECEFLDIDMLLPSDEELLDYLKKYSPDVVGISAVTSGSYRHVKNIASLIKQVSQKTIVVLGGNLSGSANLVLRRSSVDICVVGDGEIAWVKLLDSLKECNLTKSSASLKTIPGLAFIDENDGLVFTGYGEKLSEDQMDIVPDYELLRKGLQGNDHLLANYFRPGRSCSWFVHSSRAHEPDRRPNIACLNVNKGCVAKCTFCQRPTKGYRQESIDRMDEHLSYIIERFDIGFIQVVDENFGSDSAHAVQFAKLMKKHDLIWAATGVRCDSVDRELVKFFSEHNCVSLKFGVESGSQKILDIMEKKFTVEEVRNAIGWCHEFNIWSPLAIMFGMPGENLETAKETGRFLAEIALETNTLPNADDIFYLIPFPGTPAYEYGQQIGVIGASLEEEEDFLLNIFTAPTYKLSYINLNGAPLSEVLFWDVLAQLEAMRHYVKNRNSYIKPVATSTAYIPEPKKNNAIFSESILTIVKRKILARKWRITFLPYISMFLRRKVATSSTVAKMPTILVYPIVRLLLLIEHYLILYIKGNEGCYKFSSIGKKAPRIGDDYRNAFPQKRLVSLRTISSSCRTSPVDMTEQNIMLLKRGN
jgi:anaerobic magnesium-protoporphyrin IX monomethyl ester cyclase